MLLQFYRMWKSSLGSKEEDESLDVFLGHLFNNAVDKLFGLDL
jgi:hypothetical protein